MLSRAKKEISVGDSYAILIDHQYSAIYFPPYISIQWTKAFTKLRAKFQNLVVDVLFRFKNFDQLYSKRKKHPIARDKIKSRNTILNLFLLQAASTDILFDIICLQKPALKMAPSMAAGNKKPKSEAL